MWKRNIRNYYKNPNKHKIVPKDLILTSLIVKHWFYGDGYTYFVHNLKPQTRGQQVQLGLCTQGFTIQECQFLVERLKIDCNLEGFKIALNKKHQPSIRATKSSVINKFLEYIGPSDIQCFNYKWKLPTAKPYE